MLAAIALALLAGVAGAGEVELAPFAGLQFGGHVHSPVFGASFSVHESLAYGATLDIPIDEVWRVEVLFSRQSTELRAPRGQLTAFPLAVERYMVGIVEEREPVHRIAFFGVGLAGATRFVPPDFDNGSALRFAVGLSLGAKVRADDHLGLRFEARGFYTVVDAGGAIFCRGGRCLFAFDGAGLWQGDVTAGLILGF
jgi:hypothetical protein